MMPLACPHCGDVEIQLMFNSMMCTTHGCQNFDRSWEQEVLLAHRGYIALCFCQTCIHCEGIQNFVGKFRLNNTTYDVYYAFWDRGDDPDHFILIMYGDDALESNYCELHQVDKHRDLLEKNYPELVLGYDLFHNELWSRTLTEVKE